MSDDPNDKELPEEENEVSEGEASESSAEATEIDLEPVGSDEGPGSEGLSGLLGKGKMSVKDDKTFGMLVHLLGPFSLGIGTLVIWIMKKDESPFVDDQGKAAVNFQITVALAYVALTVVSSIPLIGCFAAMLFPVVGIAGAVFAILACLKANEGVLYRYPYTLNLIK